MRETSAYRDSGFLKSISIPIIRSGVAHYGDGVIRPIRSQCDQKKADDLMIFCDRFSTVSRYCFKDVLGEAMSTALRLNAMSP